MFRSRASDLGGIGVRRAERRNIARANVRDYIANDAIRNRIAGPPFSAWWGARARFGGAAKVIADRAPDRRGPALPSAMSDEAGAV